MSSSLLHRSSALDLVHHADGWEARLTGRDDARTQAFEDELVLDGERSLSLFQRRAFIAASSAEHVLFQLRDGAGRAALQAVLVVERPRRAPRFARARVHQLGSGSDGDTERRALIALRALCERSGSFASLRLQPYRLHEHALRDFEARARRVGFQLADPVGVTRTLLLDLSPGPTALLAAVSKKTRWRIRHRSREDVELRVLTDPRFIPACVAAANASLGRTGGGTIRLDFPALFALAASHPELVRITGVFHHARPEALVAFNVGVCHGTVAEYLAAGSHADPALRQLPFNYWLLWSLVEWAHASGASRFDLGGITDGGEDDRCRGISDFKRHFCDRDVEVGRELVCRLKPVAAFVLDAWSALRQRAQAR